MRNLSLFLHKYKCEFALLVHFINGNLHLTNDLQRHADY